MMDDELKILKKMIEHMILSGDCSNRQDPVQQPVSKRPTHGRLHFVITKNKSSSWAEDLYDCGCITERDRIYN